MKNPSCTRPAKRRGGSGLGFLLGMGVLAALALSWWFASGQEGDERLIDPDRIVSVTRRDLIDGVTASGRVEPLARVAVMSRASGIIKQILVEEGDSVEEGQILVELDREQLQAQLAQDRADLGSAQARFAAAHARVAEAQVRVEDPEVEFREIESDRQHGLFETGNTPKRDRDEADRLLAAARFRVEQVRASLPVLDAAVDEAEANLASAEAALASSETAFREATIRSPIHGVVLLRDKEVGDGVSSILTAGGNATQILVLGDLSKMHVEARVDEVDLGRIHESMAARITVDAYRGKELSGRVERIAPAGSIDGNGIVTFEVRVAVEDTESILRPDMTADAKLVIERRDGALTLPQRAFQRGKGGEWTVVRVTGEGEDAVSESVIVELGLSDGLQTEVVSGLSDGDRVLLPDVRGAGGRSGRRP